jgi:hypothetical protein
MLKAAKGAVAALAVMLLLGACSSSDEPADDAAASTTTSTEAGDGGTEPITTTSFTVPPPGDFIFGARNLKANQEPPPLPGPAAFVAGEGTDLVATVGDWTEQIWVDVPAGIGYTFNPVPRGIVAVPEVDTGAFHAGRFQAAVAEGGPLAGPGMLIVFDPGGSFAEVESVAVPQGCTAGAVVPAAHAGLKGEVRPLTCEGGTIDIGYLVSTDPAGVVRFAIAGTSGASADDLLPVLDTIRFGDEDGAIAVRLSSPDFTVAGPPREEVDGRYPIDLHGGTLGAQWRFAIGEANTGLVEIRNFEDHGYRIVVGGQEPFRLNARKAVTVDMRLLGAGVVPISAIPDFGFARLVTYVDLEALNG